jgi:4-oxalocrotonate tautomerase
MQRETEVASMPFITVDHFAGLPETDRQELQRRMAEAVMLHFKAPASNVRIFTRAFEPANVYVASGEWETGLPVIRAEFLPGRNLEQKRALVQSLAQITAEVLKIDVDLIRTILYERDRTEWARGDKLVADAQ